MKQFLKIYLWQVLSLITGFATMFVVTPYLASNQSYFGLYTFVISLNLFLSYADFGFLNAGVKFASEAFARGNKKEEVEILAFVAFILASVFLLFGLVILIFYFYPHSILTGLNTPDTVSLIKELFLVFILCLPILVAHRIIQLIFNIRLHDYKYQRIYSILNLFKIASVFLFFRDGEYHIIAYYALTQILTLLGVLIGAFLAKQQYEYSFKDFFRLLKFNREVYKKTKDLAFNSLFVTISWVIYYELDSLFIGKFVGLKEVAIFNICISVMTLARSLYGIIYNPFTAKFNHYIGREQIVDFKNIFYKILVFGLPLSIIPTTIIILTMKSFIFSWVGSEYATAVPIVSIMFASYYFTFLSNPTGIAMVSLQKIKSLYYISAILPVVYWVGITLSFSSMGLYSFGLFKFIAFLISGLFYFYYANRFLNTDWINFLKNNLLAVIISVLIVYFVNLKMSVFLPYQKGKFEMLQYATIFTGYNLLGFFSFYLLSKEFRVVLKSVIKEVFKIKTSVA
ncbi:MAG TPA: hypothetical protein VL125_08715 [Pelobium sp.]|nr:hypothetical protein [Pelobium sp.]